MKKNMNVGKRRKNYSPTRVEYVLEQAVLLPISLGGH
jgi:hypothetical protein